MPKLQLAFVDAIMHVAMKETLCNSTDLTIIAVINDRKKCASAKWRWGELITCRKLLWESDFTINTFQSAPNTRALSFILICIFSHRKAFFSWRCWWEINFAFAKKAIFAYEVNGCTRKLPIRERRFLPQLYWRWNWKRQTEIKPSRRTLQTLCSLFATFVCIARIKNGILWEAKRFNIFLCPQRETLTYISMLQFVPEQLRNILLASSLMLHNGTLL